MEKTKNSLFALIFPLFIAIAASVVLSAACTLIGVEFPFLTVGVGFLIPIYMLKYLEYTKDWHCYLAAGYALIAFFAYIYTRTLMIGLQGSDMPIGLLLVSSVFSSILSMDFFDLLILVVMPICSYMYFMHRRYL